jgi:hypothetical protein
MRLGLLFLVSLSLLTSCGYKMGTSDCITSCSTVSVPYACGDYSGFFTQELIRAISIGSNLIYTSNCAKYKLEVSIDCIKTEPIGFRYEQFYNGVIGKRLVASEEQLTLKANVSLKKCGTNQLVIPSFCVQETIEFDFEPETSPQNQTSYSLGQLDFENAAEDAAKIPLYRKLSKKIVDYLNAAF